MLTQEEVDRVTALWREPGWPDEIATPFAREKHRSRFTRYLERVRHLGLSGTRLIDMGCGAGTWAFALASGFDQVLGFDYTADRIATALWLRDRFGLPQVDFRVGDIRQSPIDEASAEAVFCNSVALGGLALEVILAEAFRLLRPGGVAYIGLNGPGYDYQHLASDDPELRRLGGWAIYNTLCQTRLRPMIPRIAPGGWLNRAVAPGLALLRSPVRLLASLGANPAQRAAARAIQSDLGPAFVGVLADDLRAIADGSRQAFSNPTRNRSYDPLELEAAARAAGFRRFVWGPDAHLSLRPDGTVDHRPAADTAAASAMYEGRLRVFEALMWK